MLLVPVPDPGGLRNWSPGYTLLIDIGTQTGLPADATPTDKLVSVVRIPALAVTRCWDVGIVLVIVVTTIAGPSGWAEMSMLELMSCSV